MRIYIYKDVYRAGQKITIILSYSTSYSLKYLLKKLPLSVIRFNWVGLCKNHPETIFFKMNFNGQVWANQKYLCFLLIRIEVRKWSIMEFRCHHLPHIESSNGINLYYIEHTPKLSRLLMVFTWCFDLEVFVLLNV